MGLTSTHFANPHGLPSPENYSTAQDLSAAGAARDRDFPEFYKIDSVKSFTYNKITQPEPQPPAVAGPDRGWHEDRPHRSGRLLHDRLGKRPNGTASAA
jgi:hypothetical protein